MLANTVCPLEDRATAQNVKGEFGLRAVYEYGEDVMDLFAAIMAAAPGLAEPAPATAIT
jgi:hypothetical protein